MLYTPCVWTGYSPQHMREPGGGFGTITVRAETFNNLLYDIARSLIHHGFNRLIFVAGHGSNVKIVDPLLRRIKYETGALVAYYKPYAERYMGLLKGLMENPPDETPGWHASELETSQMLAHNASLVRMDRAVDNRRRTSRPGCPKPSRRPTARPTSSSRATSISSSPMDHHEFSDTGVIGNPFRATAEKGEKAFTLYADHLVDAIAELLNRRRSPIQEPRVHRKSVKAIATFRDDWPS